MKIRYLSILILVAALLVPIPTLNASAHAASRTILTFSIVSVETDSTVTIKTHEFPANTTFTVRMGKFSTRGKDGIIVGSTDSGSGGSFKATYDIPDELKGEARIAICMDDSSGDWHADNWFWNDTSDHQLPPPKPGFNGISTFSIQSVDEGISVTIKTKNFPPDTTFTVLMGKYGTLGIWGKVVGSTDSGEGGSFKATYDIPDELKDDAKIAIRMEATSGGYFAYNWFWNTPKHVTPGQPPTPRPVKFIIPSFSIQSVVRDNTVTVKAHNFPPDKTFTVRMGAFGTAGIRGIEVGSTDTGSDGSFTATYDIPDCLQGASKIAIRMDGPDGYFAYNWLWNHTTP
jgi:lysophospholipid acyltransferase (LPLAT)-like uncharacterized protein